MLRGREAGRAAELQHCKSLAASLSAARGVRACAAAFPAARFHAAHLRAARAQAARLQPAARQQGGSPKQHVEHKGHVLQHRGRRHLARNVVQIQRGQQQIVDQEREGSAEGAVRYSEGNTGSNSWSMITAMATTQGLAVTRTQALLIFNAKAARRPPGRLKQA